MPTNIYRFIKKGYFEKSCNDWHTYKERHLVENLFLKLKNNRSFATRYEKKALYFRAVVCLVWLL